MLFLLGVMCVVIFMIVGIGLTWGAWMRSRRAGLLPEVAATAGLRYSEIDLFNSAAAPFALFREGDGRRVQNVLWNDAPGHPRVFEFGYYTLYRDDNGTTHQRWEWFACALVQHNGKWPELRVSRERLVDRAAKTLGIPDVELESEDFNRTFVVQCESAKFATDLLDPQMMELMLGTEGMIDFQFRGRFLLVTAAPVEPRAMVGLLGVAEGVLAQVPPLVWEMYGRFPDGMGTEDMPTPINRTTPEPSTFGSVGWGLAEGFGPPPPRPPFQFAPQPDLGELSAAWDSTPEVEHDLDGNPLPKVQEDPWGEGRRRE